TNFHIDRITETEIKRKIAENLMAVFWRDGKKDNVERLYHCIRQKADAYHALIDKLRTPYVISVFGEFQASIDFDEVRHCLFNEEIGLFEMYPDVSGVLYFQEESGRYFFKYAPNPQALHILDLPDGVFPAL
ncbi:MAG TPA: hypothetical protein PLB81_07760, partial [Deltaproteobacteria bacterium]|nr:hypothetical protein [Deltaproteobacteria bacterium]